MSKKNKIKNNASIYISAIQIIPTATQYWNCKFTLSIVNCLTSQLPYYWEAHNCTTKQTAHTTVRHAAAQPRGERGKAYLLQGVKGERNSKKKRKSDINTNVELDIRAECDRKKCQRNKKVVQERAIWRILGKERNRTGPAKRNLKERLTNHTKGEAHAFFR